MEIKVTKQRIHEEISKIMNSYANTNLHNQLHAIRDLNRLQDILEGKTCYPGFDLADDINTTWTISE